MDRRVSLPLLESARIASPCPARWEEMTGNDRTRFCAQCGLHVHNIAAMTAGEAEALLARAASGEDRVCARLYRRADGTVLTRDCPVGVRLRERARRAAARVAAALGLVLCAAAAAVTRDEPGAVRVRLRALEPFASICAWLEPPPERHIMGDIAMGKMIMPSRPVGLGGAAAPAGEGGS
jgi:hypothetical protein